MKIYLAGFKTIEKSWTGSTKDIYLLSSFYEHRNGKFGEYVYQKKHMLDSGAFSVITGVAKNINWDEYVDRYIKFIKKTKQKLFIELDIDNIIGLKKVEYYRNKITDAIGIKPIPVWHKSRGKEYWLKMIEEFNYVAIGGFAIRTILPNEYKYIPWFLNTARQNNCKVHGLGFTKSSLLKKYKFYSVDSTTWNVGGKFGNVVLLDKRGYPRQRYKKENSRVKNINELNLYNFRQWVKFQKYAEKNL